MNIQINCDENVQENDLRYIFYNLKNYIKKYQETENDSSYYKWNGYNKRWTLEAKGNTLMKPQIIAYCNGKTMYFKINKEAK